MKARILIVDADPILRKKSEYHLKREGYRIFSVGNSEDCLNLLTKGPLPDLLLLDIDLGLAEPDGTHLAEEISRRWELPIVFYSAHQDKATLEKTRRVHRYGLVQKTPGNEEFLISTIEIALRLYRHQHHLSQEQVRLSANENRLEQHLSRKDTLLREINHRVKNDLSMISSLIRLQSRDAEEPMDSAPLKQLETQIEAIRMVHNRLYQQNEKDGISLSSYLRDIVTLIVRRSSPGRIDLKLDIQDHSFETTRAVSLGLIVNEILTNAVKYAFPPPASGLFRLNLHTLNSQYLYLETFDPGTGYPPDFDFTSCETTGMNLIQSLVSQLEGEVSLDISEGTRYEIKIPVTVS